jgi:formylglycine-generating enzyme required for sulfatase activity
MAIGKRPHLFFSFFLFGLFLACHKVNPLPNAENTVLILGGVLSMGQFADEPDALPIHEVSLSPFLLGKTEVTNAEFSHFVRTTGYQTEAENPENPGGWVWTCQGWAFDSLACWYRPGGKGTNLVGKMNHPVVQVTWNDAKAFCAWVGGRLPTEAEWEWAASGHNAFPWPKTKDIHLVANTFQGIFPDTNFALDGFVTTAPVGHFPAQSNGLFDIGGNVWEWCEDAYHGRAYLLFPGKSPVTQHDDPAFNGSSTRVIRGGSFLCEPKRCEGFRISRRMRAEENAAFQHIGFRVAFLTGNELGITNWELRIRNYELRIRNWGLRIGD